MGGGQFVCCLPPNLSVIDVCLNRMCETPMPVASGELKMV